MNTLLRLMSLLVMALAAGCGGGSGGGAEVVSSAAEPVSMPRAAAFVLSADSKVSSCSYEHLYLTVVSLRLLLPAASGEAWHDVSLPAPKQIDLMQLSGGLLDTLRSAPLPAGRYTEVRLMLAADPMANAVQPSGGTLMPLSVPGGTTSGLKLKGNFEVPGWRSADIMLEEFNACASVVKAGNSGTYQLKPEIAARIALLPSDQEHRIDADRVLALPAGGFATFRRDATGATLQRHGSDGRLAGSEVHIGYPTLLSWNWDVLAPLAGGSYVLTWLGPRTTDEREVGCGCPLMVQRYDANGTPLGVAQQVALVSPLGDHYYPPSLPATAALSGGGFVIVSYSVLRYAADGSPAGPAQTRQFGDQPHVVALRSGGFMIVTGLSSMFAAAYGADGAEVGPPQLVGSKQFYRIPWTDFAVSALSTGGAVVAWTTEFIDWNPTPASIYVRRLAADASPLGDAITVVTGNDVRPPSIAGLDDGGFVVTWVLQGHVYARRFAADGSPDGVVTRIDSITTSATDVSVVPTGEGGFVVSWSGLGSDGQTARYGRLFDANGLLA
jgi:hypothetical protein